MAQLIKILPEFIANQIAAGEVVQRAESVVKELVENSLDSGATTIAVLIKDAGKQLIHIVDNGSGMGLDDLALATRRHATSKVFAAEDLEEIRTFGFRGEALASIASVANLEIRSRVAAEDLGNKLMAEPMKPDRFEPVAMDCGTQVFVRNLFFNVPARRKFLKSNLTEFRYISDTMIRFALAHPDVRFTFYDEETLIFDVHPAPLRQRVEEVLGPTVASGIMPVTLDEEYINISGFVGHPSIAKKSTAGQYLFLNGRAIKSKSLNYAVFQVYEHLLEKSSNPFFILNLAIDPKNVDVNVHPQKHEVKFEDERYIFSLIRKAVQSALNENNLVPELQIREQDSREPLEKTSAENYIMVNKMTGEIVEKEYSQPQSPLGSHYSAAPFYPPRSSYGNSYSYGHSFAQQTSRLASEPKSTPAELPLANHEEEKELSLFQIHKKYIIMQTAQGISIIDQHAAHERILYEKAIKAMNREFSNAQEMLFPVYVDFNSAEMLIVREIHSELDNLGYSIRIADTGPVELQRVPLDVVNGQEAASLKELIEQYDEQKKLGHTEKRDNLAASFSCKAAIKTGQELSREEMQRLVKDLFKCAMPYSCPHGRPIILDFSLTELDKRFGRIL